MYEAGSGKFPYKRGKYIVVIGRKNGFEVVFHTERQEYIVTKHGDIVERGKYSRSEVEHYIK